MHHPDQKSKEPLSRGQRRRAELRAKKELEAAPLYRRRDFLVKSLAGAGALGALALYAFQGKGAVNKVDHGLLIGALKERGNIVFDKTFGEPKRLLIVLKQFHGAKSFLEYLAADKDFFQKFTAHHEALADIVLNAMRLYGPTRVNALVESADMTGPNSGWSRDMVSTIKSLTPEVYRKTLEASYGQFLAGNAEAGMAVLFLSQAPTMLASELYNDPLKRNSINGADPKNHFSLAQTTHEKMKAFLNISPNPSDGDINSLLANLRGLSKQDSEVRHAYIRDEAARVTEIGDVTYVILGSSHLSSGDHMGEGANSPPLEDFLSSLSDTRVVVFDEAALPSLHHYKSPFALKTEVVDFKAMNVAKFRELLPNLKKYFK